MSTTHTTNGIVVTEYDAPDTEDLNAAAAPDDGELDGHTQDRDVDDPYTAQLAQRVHSIIRSAWWDCPLSARDVSGVIGEALHQIGKDIRAGRAVQVEYLGRFHRMGMGKPWVVYRADAELLRAAGEG